jgi:pantetheine-phosphate adenylyltransferase
VKFLRSQGWLKRARIVELKDHYGPATRRKRLEALVVSQETRGSGGKVNSLRRLRGLSPIRIYSVRLVKADDGLPISVTRILRGEIDSQGKSIVKQS